MPSNSTNDDMLNQAEGVAKTDDIKTLMAEHRAGMTFF